MQKRHTDRKMYFRDLEITSKEFYISYLSDFTELTSKSRILEVGCGEGGNLVPFAQLGCKVTGIDVAECRIKDAGKSSVSCPLKPSDSTPLKHSTMPP